MPVPDRPRVVEIFNKSDLVIMLLEAELRSKCHSQQAIVVQDFGKDCGGGGGSQRLSGGN